MKLNFYFITCMENFKCKNILKFFSHFNRRQALEAKAALYEKMARGEIEGTTECCFQLEEVFVKVLFCCSNSL